MSQDTRDYYAGQDAYENGLPVDPNASDSWKEGWEDAYHADEGGWE